MRHQENWHLGLGWHSTRATSTRVVGLMAGYSACSRSWDPGPLEDLVTSFLRWRARQTWLIGKEEIEYIQDPDTRQNRPHTKPSQLAKRNLRSRMVRGVSSIGAEGSRRGVSRAERLGHPGFEPLQDPSYHSTLPLGTRALA